MIRRGRLTPPSRSAHKGKSMGRRRRRKYYKRGVLYAQDGPEGCGMTGCSTQGLPGCIWGCAVWLIIGIVVLAIFI